MNFKQDIKNAKILFKSYNVKCRFVQSLFCSGYYCPTNKTITIGLTKHRDRDDFWSTVFHELVHHLCTENDIWKKYHWSSSNKYNKRVALNAEKYVDSKAKILCKFYQPDVKYKSGYATKKDKQWLIDYYS